MGNTVQTGREKERDRDMYIERGERNTFSKKYCKKRKKAGKDGQREREREREKGR